MDQITARRDIQSLADVAQKQAQIGLILSEIETIDAATREKIAPILLEAERRVARLRKEALAIARGIDRFARKHKRALLTGRSKTVEIPGGAPLSWRISPRAISIADEKALLARLLAQGPDEFIRITPSINRERMLERPRKAAQLPGVTITQERKFIIKVPQTETRIERTLNTSRLVFAKPRSRRS